MKRSNVQEQSDLFTSMPGPPALTSLQEHHHELVELVSRLLWEVVQGSHKQTKKESNHEQDQR